MGNASLAGGVGGAVSAPAGLLSAQFINYGSVEAGAADIVYIAANTTANKIDLQLLLTSGTATLAPGDVVDPDDLPPSGSQSLFYLDLSALELTDAAWGKLTPTADGFTCKVYADDQVVAMAPSAADVVLNAVTPLAIHLDGFELDSAPPAPSPQLSVTYYNVPGVTSGKVSRTANFSVAAQNPPSGQADLTTALQVQVTPTTVVNSRGAKQPLENVITLEFSRKQQTVAVPAGADTVFTISFVYGGPDDDDGYGALTDVPSAQEIAPVKGDNVDDWKATPFLQAESPYWTLQPPDGEAIAGTGVTAVRSWQFTKIATTYQPGPTVMLVQYKNVPGYSDGVLTIVLNKIPHAVVSSVSIEPNPTVLDAHGKADVTVSWEVDYATKLTLTQNYAPLDVTNKTSIPLTLSAQSTHFTLTAEGPGADVDNSDYGNATAIALPVINSFQGAPTEVYSGSGSHGVDLRWAVQTSGKVAITSSTGQEFGTGFAATGQAPVTVDQAQMITMAPVAEPGVSAPSRNLVIDAFKPLLTTATLSAPAVAAAASPSAPFVAVVTAAGEVIALDTVQFSAITSTTAGKAPTGLAFSPDGGLLVVLNGDATASLISVAVTAGLPSFSPLQTLKLGGNPRSVIVTPDRSTLYFSVDGTPGTLAVATLNGTQYAVGVSVTLGDAPRGMAMLPSGAQLFVANSADDTISVVGVTLDGGVKALTPIQLSSTGHPAGIHPTGLAVTADGGTLLAACTGTGVVWAIETSNPNGGNRQSLTVGSEPAAVAVTPGGAYAFVANSGDGTLSLLDVWDGAGACKVLGPALSTSLTATGVTISPDGLVVIATDPNTAKLAVYTLAIYALNTVADDVGPSPSNVLTTGDGKAALVWKNAMVTGSQPVTGVRYYSLASGVSTEMLSDIAPVACVAVPGSAELYAIDSGETTLYVADLSDPKNPHEQAVDLGVQDATVGLAISGDGATVFAVTAGQTGQHTLLVGTVGAGAWTTAQSIPLYSGTRPGPISAAVTPDGSTVFVADAPNQQFVTLTRGTNGQYALASPQLKVPGAFSVTIAPDSTTAWVVAGTTPESVTIVDIPSLTGTSVSTLQSYVNLRGLALSPDGRYLFGADASAAALRILDPRSLRVLQTTPLAADVSQAEGASSLAVAPDGSSLFVANRTSGTLSVLQQYSM